MDKREGGMPLRVDPTATSADASRPAFVAKPAGAPVYFGFPLVEESRLDGWCFGTITEFEDAAGTTYGDAFIQAPDGSRAGLVWEVGDCDLFTILEPEPGRWGVYGVCVPAPIKTTRDFVASFHKLLPDLRRIHAAVMREDRDSAT